MFSRGHQSPQLSKISTLRTGRLPYTSTEVGLASLASINKSPSLHDACLPSSSCQIRTNERSNYHDYFDEIYSTILVRWHSTMIADRQLRNWHQHNNRLNNHQNHRNVSIFLQNFFSYFGLQYFLFMTKT